MIDRLYQGIRRNKLLTAGVVGYSLACVTIPSTDQIVNYFIPEDFRDQIRVEEIDSRLRHPINLTLRDLVKEDHYGLNSFVEEASSLASESDSLISLPNYEEQRDLLDKKRNLKRYLIDGGGVFGLLSGGIIFIGLLKRQRRLIRERSGKLK